MWKKQFIETSRGRFEIFMGGSGEALCVTHLYSEFNERGYYFADAFLENFTVYLVNLKEAGNSCKADNDAGLSMVETVKDLEAIRAAIGLEQWAFAGHSTGGMLGLVYALLFPESLSKLMTGGASASRRYMEHEGSMYCPRSPLNRRVKEIFAVLNSPGATLEEKKAANQEWTDMSLYHPSKRDEYFRKPSSGRVVRKRLDYYSFQELPLFDIQEDLSKIITPTIVYGGRYDAQCPLVFSEEIYEGIRDAKLYVFEESNHVPYLEERDKFDRMVRDFEAYPKKECSGTNI